MLSRIIWFLILLLESEAVIVLNEKFGYPNSSEFCVMKWVCTSCGYVYDPATGDVEHGIKLGIPFEQLDDSWQCPICYAAKEAFDPL